MTLIEDDAFIGPNATFTDDPLPRSKQHLASHPRTIVRAGAPIGANATTLPGLTIGQRAMVGAGAVVTRSVLPNAIVRGNPARITGYVDSVKAPRERVGGEAEWPAVALTSVARVTRHGLPLVHDLRGDPSANEFERHVPFTPRRYFLVFNVSTRDVRGEHAHRDCHQFLVVYALGIALAYVLYSRYVFEVPLACRKAMGFPLVYAVQWLLGVVLLWILVELATLRKESAALVVIAMGAGRIRAEPELVRPARRPALRASVPREPPALPGWQFSSTFRSYRRY